MQLDPTRFASTVSFLNTLPDGLDSFPECRVKADVFHDARDMVRPHVDASSLPSPLADYVAGRPAGDWIPDVWGTVLNMMVREACFESDEAALKWVYDVSASVYRRPWYRVLMLVMSPTLVLMGASKRWKGFRQGTQLVAERAIADENRRLVNAYIDHPAGLYSQFMLRTFCSSFEAAINSAGAKDTRVQIGDAGPSRTLFRVIWSA